MQRFRRRQFEYPGGVLPNGHALTKTGAGTLYLSSANSCVSPISILGGVLQVSSPSLVTNDTISSISDGQLIAQYHIVGQGGTGVFTQTGGVNATDCLLTLGDTVGSSGTYNLSGTGSISSMPSEYVGSSGTGTLTQSGGTNNAYTVILGYNACGVGSYSLSGSGNLSAYDEQIGLSGSGSFTQSGGTNSPLTLELALNPTVKGSYSLGKGVLSVSQVETIGDTGQGTFSQTGGTNICNTLYLTCQPGASGTSYSLSGSGLSRSLTRISATTACPPCFSKRAASTRPRTSSLAVAARCN